MFSSTKARDHKQLPNTNTTNNKTQTIIQNISSSSKTSSTSSSSPPLNNNVYGSDRTRSQDKTMEDVWNDINLSSLQEYYNTTTITANTNTTTTATAMHDIISQEDRGFYSMAQRKPLINPDSTAFVLQDFLARPFNKDPVPLDHHNHTNLTNNNRNNRSATLYGSSSSSSLPRPHQPATVLSLNSVGTPGFDFLDDDNILPARPPGGGSGCNSSLHLQQSNNKNNNTTLSSFTSLNNMSVGGGEVNLFEGLGTYGFGKKRVQESDSNSSGDRKHKRMIKNRESAARSRARKQAYTNELEREVALLMEENARLKMQQEQLQLAAAAQQTKKHGLHRTSTAPF